MILFFFFGVGFNNEQEDVNYISEFIGRIPDRIKIIYDNSNLLDLLDKKHRTIKFHNSLIDYRELIYSSSKEIKINCENVVTDINSNSNDFYKQYQTAGLTNDQLKLKGAIFTQLWEK